MTSASEGKLQEKKTGEPSARPNPGEGKGNEPHFAMKEKEEKKRDGRNAS